MSIRSETPPARATTDSNSNHEMKLPPELYDTIIEQIPPEDRLTLQNCALVCRLFSACAQKALFRTISLGRPSKSFRYHIQSLRHPTRQFFILIGNSPHLSGYVQELEISDDSHRHFYREELSWIRRDTVLATILSKLDRLKALAISGNHSGNRLNFKAWNEDLKKTILTRCQSGSLTRLSLNYVRNVPASIFTQAPALESVYIFKCVFIVDEVPLVGREVFRPKLKTFELTTTTYYEWTAFYPWLQDEERSVDLTGLTSLGLHVDSTMPGNGLESLADCLDAIAWVVRQCAATIENLRLFYPFEVSSPTVAVGTFVDLSKLPSLRWLSMHGNIWAHLVDEPPNRLPWLIAILKQIPDSLSMESLTLLCTMEDATDPSELADADWDAFTHTIEGLAARTREVYVSVSLFDSCVMEARAIVEDRLRGLRERGIVHVRSVVETGEL